MVIEVLAGKMTRQRADFSPIPLPDTFPVIKIITALIMIMVRMVKIMRIMRMMRMMVMMMMGQLQCVQWLRVS